MEKNDNNITLSIAIKNYPIRCTRGPLSAHQRNTIGIAFAGWPNGARHWMLPGYQEGKRGPLSVRKRNAI